MTAVFRTIKSVSEEDVSERKSGGDQPRLLLVHGELVVQPSTHVPPEALCREDLPLPAGDGEPALYSDGEQLSRSGTDSGGGPLAPQKGDPPGDPHASLRSGDDIKSRLGVDISFCLFDGS